MLYLSGLELYDFNARTNDQQIGRFIQIDPLSEDGNQESLAPYQFSGNNPATFNDPDGKCPWCLGAIVGALVEYGTEVIGNIANGRSLGESFTNADGGAILISAVAGAASGGVSTFVPKSTAAKILVGSVKVGIDAAESASKQYSETGSVSPQKIGTDILSNKLGEGLSKNIKTFPPSSIKTSERQLNRAQRVAAGDPSSKGRELKVQKLENQLTNKKNANMQ